MGKSENHGISPKFMENHGKFMENHGKIMGLQLGTSYCKKIETKFEVVFDIQFFLEIDWLNPYTYMIYHYMYIYIYIYNRVTLLITNFADYGAP